MWKKAIIAAAVIATGLASPQPRAASANGDPLAFIDDLGDQVIELLKTSDATADKRKTGLVALFTAAFDINTMARFVVAQHWRDMTGSQKRAYLDAFRTYVVNMYADKFAGYAGQTFEVGRSREINASESLVSAAIVEPGGGRIDIGFRVRAKGDRLSVVDVTVSGASLLVTKRSEFVSVIEREGPEGLIERLRKLQARIAQSPT